MSQDKKQPLDIQHLVDPLAEDNPCGEDLPSYDKVFSAIDEAGRSDDPTPPRGIWERDLKRSDWSKVRELCEQALQTRSKDLRLAASLCEAMLHLEGLGGLSNGLKLMTELVDRYWDNGLHPFEEGTDGQPDHEFRINIIAALGVRLPTVVRLLPVTEPGEGVERVYSLADWEETILLERLSVKDHASYEEAERSGRPVRSKFLSAVMFSSLEFYQNLTSHAQAALENLDGLNNILNERCGEHGPGLSALRDAISGVLHLAEKFAAEKGGGEVEQEEGTPNTQETEETPGEQAPTPGLGQKASAKSGPISSRAEAYRMLNRAADYLMATEPHSPAPYLVKRAVSWGNMSLTELFREIVQDERDLDSILALLGVRDLQG